MNNTDYEKYKKLLAERLNEKRYYHSLCVADEAKRLAIKYGADAEKCYLAGLLHDITKNTSNEEHLKIFDTFGIMLTAEEGSFKLWHAISGALYIKYVLNIDDEEIYDAVRYHTTAKANMPLMSKILYLADYTSRDRDYEDVDIMRKLVDISIEEAMKYALKYTITDLVNLDRVIHPDTVSAYNEVMLKDK